MTGLASDEGVVSCSRSASESPEPRATLLLSPVTETNPCHLVLRTHRPRRPSCPRPLIQSSILGLGVHKDSITIVVLREAAHRSRGPPLCPSAHPGTGSTGPTRVVLWPQASTPAMRPAAIFPFHARPHFLDVRIRQLWARCCVSRWRAIKLASARKSSTRNSARPAEIVMNASAAAALVHAAGMRFSWHARSNRPGPHPKCVADQPARTRDRAADETGGSREQVPADRAAPSSTTITTACIAHPRSPSCIEVPTHLSHVR